MKRGNIFAFCIGLIFGLGPGLVLYLSNCGEQFTRKSDFEIVFCLSPVLGKEDDNSFITTYSFNERLELIDVELEPLTITDICNISASSANREAIINISAYTPQEVVKAYDIATQIIEMVADRNDITLYRNAVYIIPEAHSSF